MSYEVRLPVFEGPLDLLLHLIERQELDITAISLARVTDQYLAYLSDREQIDPATIADFLLVAAKLLLLKSRMLLPQPPRLGTDDEAEEEDVGEELARQLREYQRFKVAATSLAEREAQGLRAHVRVGPPPSLPTHLDQLDVSLDELLAAVRQALAVQPQPPVSQVVAPITISIADKMTDIRALTAGGRPVAFSQLLAAAQSRVEIVITFLALLELMKQRVVTVQQDRLFGEILIAGQAG